MTYKNDVYLEWGAAKPLEHRLLFLVLQVEKGYEPYLDFIKGNPYTKNWRVGGFFPRNIKVTGVSGVSSSPKPQNFRILLMAFCWLLAFLTTRFFIRKSFFCPSLNFLNIANTSNQAEIFLIFFLNFYLLLSFNSLFN